MARCPQCANTGLRHAQLADRLAGHACEQCGGILLSLVAYRSWRDANISKSDDIQFVDETVTVDDSDIAKECSKCSGLMTKYRISAAVANRLDYCARCEDIWLDDGEWALVENLATSGHLAKVFSQPWQTRIRSEIAKDREDERLMELLGDEWDFFASFRNWLNRNPAKDRLIAYLQRRRR